MRVQIKICGITSAEDACLALDLGADFLGLNFFAGSPRCVDLAVAKGIRRAVGSAASLVGVFVRRPRAEIEAIAEGVDLDLLQFHGDESPEDLEPFAARAIKVWRLEGPPDPDQLKLYASCWGFLFDAFDPRLYGGSGRSWDYSRLAAVQTPKPIFVAGGLGPENVASAATVPGLFGLDVCSGVEASPGRKDPGLMRRLFEEVRHGEATRTA